MACTSYHKDTNRWLTSFGPDAATGSEHTISVGHPLFGGEFTTFRLGPVVAHDERGEPLFDEDEAEISICRPVLFGGEGNPGPDWMKRRDVRNAVAEANQRWPLTLTLNGRIYERGGFGQWREVVAA